MTRAGLHLSPAHPLAGIAAGHCAEHLSPLVGGVACGECWERAIRDDERVVVEFGLDPDASPGPDPDLVDEIAVERACAGERVPLTDAELASAIQRLRRAGWSRNAIADQLRAAERTVAREAPPLPHSELRVRRQRGPGVAA
jgi:hypothetical protein